MPKISPELKKGGPEIDIYNSIHVHTIWLSRTRKCIVYLQFSIFDMYEEKCDSNQKA